ncbi:MAG: PQQ-binding-like beta-propeller repeat protein [Lentisphaerales bacterium]|nr:PQQ-binding-like beta-propeller repeat protein [Lentisphaerales bacterium]
MKAFLSIFISFLLISCVAQQKLHWPDKHGPQWNGTVPDSASKGLPLKWGGEKEENIIWKTPLERLGHSTPVIAGKKIWFTSATEDGKQQFIYCLDSNTGKVIHHKLLFENSNPEPLGNTTNNYATPSCFLEEDAVYVHFGTYGTARLNPDTAEIIWQRRDIEVRHYRGPASSPIIYKDLLILTFDGVEDKQFTLAVNKHTGKDVWKTKRSVDFKDLVDGKPKREGDFRKAFDTPALAEVGDQTVLLSVGSRAAYGYDVDTGKELWILKHKNYNAAVRPLWLLKEQMVIINTGSAKANLHGLKLSPDTKGDVTDKPVWSQRRASRYCMPVYKDGYIYQITHDGNVSCIDVKTGETKWKEALVRSFMASPILVGDKVYIFDTFGESFVFEASSKSFNKLASNHIDDDFSACVAVADGSLYLRGKKFFYKIGRK